MNILGIESSCDETAAAVIRSGDVTEPLEVLSNVVASQIEQHRLYGGVVPELASRMHCESISAVVTQALERACVTIDDIDVIAVTAAPGLAGALLVGTGFAQGLARAYGKPLVPVHHIRGHIASCYLPNTTVAGTTTAALAGLTPPYLCLVCSGGHSHIIKVNGYTDFAIIGRTTDDAAGECFDKAARAMGLPYPGGREIERVAAGYVADRLAECAAGVAANTEAETAADSAAGSATATAAVIKTQIIQAAVKKYNLPLPHTEQHYDYSFSGLKTAVINIIHRAAQKNDPLDIPALACAFQHTIARYLTKKFIAAAENCANEHANGNTPLAFAGGVAANGCIRAALSAAAEEHGFPLYIPALTYCGDNAAMIAAQGFYEYTAGVSVPARFDARATMNISDNF